MMCVFSSLLGLQAIYNQAVKC